jgi:hypothetical protein
VGKVESVSGSCPAALTFVLNAETVFTTPDTAFKKMHCRDVKIGIDLKVTGWRMSDGTVRADKVEAQ